MAALINAETGLGASGWARGSHACSGTAPALDVNAAATSTNTSPRSVGDTPCAPARRAAKVSPPACAAKTENPTSRRISPRWVITAYQAPACRTEARSRCSASTSSSEPSAISSHSTRNVDTDAATGTRTKVSANSGSTPCAVRDPSPCGP